MLNLHLKSNKKRRWGGGDAAADRSKGFVLFPLPDHVCINYAASEASTLRKRKGRIFYADERQFEMWSGGGGGVPES